MRTINKIFAVFSILAIIFFFGSTKVNANTLFYDNGIGSIGEQWIPSGWISKTTDGIYSADGVIGPFDYFRDFIHTDLILKFDLNIHNALSNVVFACRANSNYSDIEQGQLTGNGQPGTYAISNATECLSNNCYGIGTPNPYSWIQSQTKHQVELDCIGTNFTLKYDNKVLTSGTISNSVNGTGIRIYSSGGNNSFSNISVCDASGCSDPTPTPTPTPEVSLNVPLVKQTSDPWQSQEYDTAHLWSPNSPTIRDWGCALTSATMILQYNGIAKMPDNSNLDPGSLNTWLRLQPDGYIQNGLVNWLAVSRLSRLIKLAFNNPTYSADALEWKWSQNNTNTQLAQDLHNNIPDILNEPGHFIVVKGTQGTTFTINDPSANKTLLTDYGNTFTYAGKFIPSHTDLSYILLSGPENLTFDAKTATGSSIGQSFIQSPLTNDSNPLQTNGAPVKLFYIEQPPTDSYQLTITGANSQIYNVKVYTYDQQGNVVTTDIQGSLDNTHPNTVTIPFSKIQNANDQIKRQVTMPLLLFDLQTLYHQNLIKRIPYILFNHIFLDLQKAAQKNKILEEKILLRISSAILTAERPLEISDQAYQLISNDITFLLVQLR